MDALSIAVRPSPLARRCLCLLALAAAAACAQPGEAPGTRLQARAEAYALSQQAAWKADLPHYALVFPIEPGDFDAYMARMLPRFEGRDVVLGSAEGVERHGGGVLAFVLAHWRPDGRAAQLSDRFWFARNRSRIALSQIAASHRRQIFLPVPGRATAAIDGQLPDAPQLARMWFRHRTAAGRSESTEVDAYPFLALLVEREPDPSQPWTNELGQSLSVDRLLADAWAHYLAGGAAAGEISDHSNLHLVGLLLAYGRRRAAAEPAASGAFDPNAIKRRFLADALARTELTDEAWNLHVGHALESLGQLLADPRVDWSGDEKRRVNAWLRNLDGEIGRELSGVEAAHFVTGLRGIAAQRAKLAEPAP